MVDFGWWGFVAMLSTWRYCTCPGLYRNEEMELTWILTSMALSGRWQLLTGHGVQVTLRYRLCSGSS
ncbi:hypothetical protein NQZ68_026574 [Dissostichus eleginoides]|nr:hypothetical protein NQZ68_026574 [Dissostichus eleginoides]